MEIVKKIIDVLLLFSIGFALANTYLTINKIWSRKHLRVVAESISVVGRLLALFGNMLIAISLLNHKQWLLTLDRSIYIIAAVIQLLIGIGMWIGTEKHKGFLKLFWNALNLERKESTNLAKAILKPENPNLIINNLAQIALIDKVLDDREKEFIQNFVDSWQIHFSWENFEKKLQRQHHYNLTELRQMAQEYLDTKPSIEQVGQLGDLITTLVRIDDQVSEEEELMLAELTGLLNNYISQDISQETFSAAIIPQTVEQNLQLQKLLGEKAQRKALGGGMAYILGPFYSKKYADIICEKFRKRNYLSISVQTTWGEE